MIGHELTALHGIDHAQTLAIVGPRLWEVKLNNKEAKLAQYGRRVWNLSGDDRTVAEQAIEKTEAFFHSLGVATHIREYSNDCEQTPAIIRKRFEERSWLAMGEKQDLTPEEVEIIVTKAL
jgi:NADP-dependent alcohol dehydrogenase